MYQQPRYDPLEPSAFFDDQRSARPLVQGVVQRGDTRTDTHFYTGQVDGRFVDTFPYEITSEVFYQGQQRYNIFCAPCHGLTGDGRGMIAQRSERMNPASFYEQRLIDAPVGFYFEIITNGYRTMYGYSDRINEADRWAIIAYIRALQYSKRATISDVPANERPQLEQEQP